MEIFVQVSLLHNEIAKVIEFAIYSYSVPNIYSLIVKKNSI
jgi:hypothetical protein